jgi:hypothetical protein
MIRKALLAAAGAATLAVTGCGGGDSNKALSYSAFGTEANKICQDAEAKNKALGKTTTAEATPENGVLIGKLLDIVKKQRDDIKALKAPDQLTAARDAFVKVADEQIAVAEKAKTAANAKDQAGFVAAGKELQALTPQQRETGSKLGAAACAS